jgi:hypothetical protein
MNGQGPAESAVLCWRRAAHGLRPACVRDTAITGLSGRAVKIMTATWRAFGIWQRIGLFVPSGAIGAFDAMLAHQDGSATRWKQPAQARVDLRALNRRTLRQAPQI